MLGGFFSIRKDLLMIYRRCIKRNVCVNLAYFSFDTSFFVTVFVIILWLRGQGIVPPAYIRKQCLLLCSVS